MLAKKNERPKIYLAVVLSIVLLVVLYFRYGHKKPTHTAASARSKPGVVTRLDVPQIQLPNLKGTQQSKPATKASKPFITRDIFRPLKGLPLKGEAKRNRQKTPKLTAPLKLKGTIIGGENSVAVINDQFVHAGDRIGGYRVVRIGEKKVLLDSGDDQIALEILKNE
jgi:hypothetical protein